MQTVITLALLIVAGLVLFAILASIRAMARTVWLKIGPFLVALAASFATLAVLSSAVRAYFNQDAVPWVTASVFIAALVASYMLSRKWFAKNWTDKIDAPIAPMKPAVKLVEPPPAPRTTFAPLLSTRRLWRRIQPTEAERFRHLIGYLRMAAPDERTSLDFADTAILRMWSRTDDCIDLELIGVRSKVSDWLRDTEAELVQAEKMSKAQQLVRCEMAVQRLELVAFESRSLLAKRADMETEALKLRHERISQL